MHKGQTISRNSDRSQLKQKLWRKIYEQFYIEGLSVKEICKKNINPITGKKYSRSRTYSIISQLRNDGPMV